MIAVTGANGLLGSFIVKALVQNNFKVVALVRSGSDRSLLREVESEIELREADVSDVPALVAAFKDVSMVVHAAAMVSFNPRRVDQIMDVNVEGTRNVVDVCLTLGIPKVVHISSVAALGRQKGVERINEESKWIDGPLNSDYGESKYLAELELFRGREEGLKVSMVNPSVILAPADWSKSSAQIFKYVYDQNLFYTSGSLNWVDVRDVVAMVLCLVEDDHDGEKYIANSSAVTYLNFFEKTAKRLGKRAPSILVREPWTYIAGWLEEVKCFVLGREPVITRQTVRIARESFHYDATKAEKDLGIRFRQLDETLDWCCGEYLRKNNTNKHK